MVPPRHHHHHHHSGTTASRNVSGASITGTSPQNGTAQETFLNYFFGQNGPGPLSGPNVERTAGAATGRDVSGADPSLESGLMAGKRTMDRSNAAYDMKSLCKHIEAVSHVPPPLPAFTIPNSCA